MLTQIQVLEREVKALKAENARLHAKAYIDPLAEIPNRLAYQERKPVKGESYIFLDVDKFKGINDRFGHEAGDQVLRAISQVVRSQADHCYRVGGDEFLVIVNGNTHAAELIGHRISEAVALLSLPGVPSLSISCGVGATLQEADRVMQAQKQARGVAR